jgi:hypothetical protein
MKALFAVVLLSLPALAADQAPAAALRAACGAENMKFSASAGGQQPAAQPEPGRALVYVVEQFEHPENALVTPTLRIGMDGAWVGATYGTSYLSVPVDPGDHHLCTDWQSLPPLMPINAMQPSLAGLKAEAGQIYYFRARIIQHSGSGPWTLDLDPVNSDEGQLLVATSPASSSRQKK